jgi:hypothetical protein
LPRLKGAAGAHFRPTETNLKRIKNHHVRCLWNIKIRMKKSLANRRGFFRSD